MSKKAEGLVSFSPQHQRLSVRPDTAEVSSSSRRCLVQPPAVLSLVLGTTQTHLGSPDCKLQVTKQHDNKGGGGMMYIKAKGNNK